MNKLKTILIYYVFLLSISIIVEGCCIQSFEIIGNGEMVAYEDISNEETATNIIDGAFVIRVWFENRIATNNKNFNLIPTANALGCNTDFKNMLLTETLSLKLDKEFEYNGDAYPVGIDFSNIEELDIEIDKEFGIIDFYFNEEFIEKVNFSSGQNTFQLQIETDNQLTLTSELTLEIKL